MCIKARRRRESERGGQESRKPERGKRKIRGTKRRGLKRSGERGGDINVEKKYI